MYPASRVVGTFFAEYLYCRGYFSLRDIAAIKIRTYNPDSNGTAPRRYLRMHFLQDPRTIKRVAESFYDFEEDSKTLAEVKYQRHCKTFCFFLIVSDVYEFATEYNSEHNNFY